MSSGIIIKEVYLLDVKKATLHDKLIELEQDIAREEAKLLTLMGSTPRELLNSQGEREYWLDYIMFQKSEIMECLEEYYVNRHLINVALDNLNNVEDEQD